MWSVCRTDETVNLGLSSVRVAVLRLSMPRLLHFLLICCTSFVAGGGPLLGVRRGTFTMSTSEHGKLSHLLVGGLAGKTAEVAAQINGARLDGAGLRGRAGGITIGEAPANFNAEFEGELVLKAVRRAGSTLQLDVGLPLGMGDRKLQRQKQWMQSRTAGEAEKPSEYEQAQASKLGTDERQDSMIRQFDKVIEAELTKRFSSQRHLIFSPIVCVGARLGGEVRAFENAAQGGALALGVDFNPGRRNAHVMWGDAHTLRFRNASIGTAYTNILDHLLFYGRFADEMHRVLRPGGTLFVDMDQKPTDDWASHDLREQRPKIERLLRLRFSQLSAKLLTAGEKDVPKWVYVFQKA